MADASRASPDASALAIDAAAEAARIAAWMRETVGQGMHRRGAVVAVSGGIDSAVCAALSVRALGPDKVLALLLPERESSPHSTERGLALCQALQIDHLMVDITGTLETLGCYRQRDEAVQRVFAGYEPGWGCRIAIDGGLRGGINFFQLQVRSPQGEVRSARLPHRDYLQIVAATNFKQRVRKTLEYFHADRLNRAVVGTPNRLEFDQGFFVKQGDGTADIKPIAHLYKTQVVALARALQLPDDIVQARPSTDTYPMPQGQDEFFFALPLQQMDLALWAEEHGRDGAALARMLDVTVTQAKRILQDIRAKRAAAAHLHAAGWTLRD